MKEIVRDARGRDPKSHKLFLIKRLSMENTQIGKGYPRGIISFFEFKTISNHPLEQIHNLINMFEKKFKIL